MLQRLRNVFAKRKESTGAPMERWNSHRLEETRIRLEATPLEELTAADQHEAVDYLVQRYLPSDEPIKEQQWQAKREKLHARVDANMELQWSGQAPMPEWQRLNEMQAERERLLRSPYVMSLADFAGIVLPSVSRFPLASGLDELSAPDTEALFLATLLYHSNELPGAKRERSDWSDWLIGKVDRAAIDLCRDFRANYGWLRNAAHAGYIEVRRLSAGSCGCTSATPGSRSIADALQTIETGTEDLFVVPPLDALCAGFDSARVCRVSLVAEEPPNLGNDPDFAVYLKAQFQR